MDNPFIGTVMLFGGNFPPRGFLFCNGQTMSIAQNTALFALLGTTYGGNGQTTFALPDLRGRVPIHFGQGPGLSNFNLGEVGGAETVTLLSTEMPQHTHTVNVNTGNGTTNNPTGNFFAATPAFLQYTNGAANNTSFIPNSIGNAGGSQPHNNLQPYLAINYCIAIEGIFPSRN